jgi:O-acetyl-ADP-ribose deacetylase (regulator of RNase III)
MNEDETLEIISGDVFQGDSDVLMNPCNCERNLYWGTHVSGHIFWHAGKKVKKERDKAGFLKFGEYCLTSGGKLKHKHILHIAVHKAKSLDMGYLFKRKKRIEEETLKKTLDSIHDFCKKNSFDKIDIPLFWGRTNGWSDEEFKKKFSSHKALDKVIIYKAKKWFI